MKYLILITASVFSLSLSAAEVTGLNTFVSGEKALASEVNDNFDAVADAINENSTDIEDKQNAITAPCPTNQFMKGVNTDGSPICAIDQIGSTDLSGITTNTNAIDANVFLGFSLFNGIGIFNDFVGCAWITANIKE